MTNMVVLAVGGSVGAAVLNVENNVTGVSGALINAVTSSMLIMGSVYYGQKDRSDFKKMFRVSMRIGMIMSAILIAISVFLRGPIAGMFFSKDAQGYIVAQTMLILFPLYIPLNLLYDGIVKMYQSEGHTKFTGVFSSIDNLILAGTAVVMGHLIGIEGIWLSLPVGQLISLFVMIITIWIMNRDKHTSLNHLLFLDESFGLDEKDILNMCIRSIDEIPMVTEEIIHFTTAKGADSKTSYCLQLAAEDTILSIVEHGFDEAAGHHIDLILIYEAGKYTLRIWDSCKLLDPFTQMEQLDSNDPTFNLGLKLVVDIADSAIYTPELGFNMLEVVMQVL